MSAVAVMMRRVFCDGCCEELGAESTGGHRECGGDGGTIVLTESREGMVTVYDSGGRYLGCMGIETWRRVLEDFGASVVSTGSGVAP